MLKAYVKTRETARRFISDRDGVVSLEYVIVGAVVCAVVVAVFNGTGTNTLRGALDAGFSAIATSVSGA